MKDKTAMQKFLKWCAKTYQPDFLTDDCSWWLEARRLALEEAKEKPGAPASLVEEIITETICPMCRRLNPQHKDCTSCPEIAGYRSRYRPSPQADIVGVVKELLENGSECYCHADGYLGPQPCAYCRAKEIIRKHEGAK